MCVCVCVCVCVCARWQRVVQSPSPPAGMSSLPRTPKALSAHLDPCFSSARDVRRASSGRSLLLPLPPAGPVKVGRPLYVLLASKAPALPCLSIGGTGGRQGSLRVSPPRCGLALGGGRAPLLTRCAPSRQRCPSCVSRTPGPLSSWTLAVVIQGAVFAGFLEPWTAPRRSHPS